MGVTAFSEARVVQGFRLSVEGHRCFAPDLKLSKADRTYFFKTSGVGHRGPGLQAERHRRHATLVR